MNTLNTTNNSDSNNADSISIGRNKLPFATLFALAFAFALALALTLTLAPAANAAQRYASPTGTGAPSVCAVDNPCNINDATNSTYTSDGDEVILAAGDYTVTSTVGIAEAIEVHGARRGATGSDRDEFTDLSQCEHQQLRRGTSQRDDQ